MEPLDEYVGNERSKIEKILELQLEMLFGSASEFNKRMIEEKVYNSAVFHYVHGVELLS